MMQLSQPSAGVPKRVILPYAGAIADVPRGWFLCNGLNGTPDLTDSFILGGTEAQLGQVGGTQTVTPSGSVNTGISGSVNTGISGSVNTGISGGVSTGISGGVSTGISGGVSVSNHTLSAAQMPSHNHGVSSGYRTYTGNTSWAYHHAGSGTQKTSGNAGSSNGHSHGISNNLSASSSHNISASSSHDISAASGFTGAAQDNRPKFYKAAYIMFVG